jgi:hypothetical protein
VGELLLKAREERGERGRLSRWGAGGDGGRGPARTLAGRPRTGSASPGGFPLGRRAGAMMASSVARPTGRGFRTLRGRRRGGTGAMRRCTGTVQSATSLVQIEFAQVCTPQTRIFQLKLQNHPKEIVVGI